MSPDTAFKIAEKLAALILDLVPAPMARQLIDDAAVRRANAIADVAEDAVVAAGKFGGDLR